MWTILQLHFGDPDVHFELQPQPSRGIVELGLHFEGTPEANNLWAAYIASRAGDLIGPWGTIGELEAWTASWAPPPPHLRLRTAHRRPRRRRRARTRRRAHAAPAHHRRGAVRSAPPPGRTPARPPHLPPLERPQAPRLTSPLRLPLPPQRVRPGLSRTTFVPGARSLFREARAACCPSSPPRNPRANPDRPPVS